jgi:predicted MarR family transcription regulator
VRRAAATSDTLFIDLVQCPISRRRLERYLAPQTRLVRGLSAAHQGVTAVDAAHSAAGCGPDIREFSCYYEPALADAAKALTQWCASAAKTWPLVGSSGFGKSTLSWNTLVGRANALMETCAIRELEERDAIQPRHAYQYTRDRGGRRVNTTKHVEQSPGLRNRITASTGCSP